MDISRCSLSPFNPRTASSTEANSLPDFQFINIPTETPSARHFNVATTSLQIAASTNLMLYLEQYQFAAQGRMLKPCRLCSAILTLIYFIESIHPNCACTDSVVVTSYMHGMA
jgi:hypothetical protein